MSAALKNATPEQLEQYAETLATADLAGPMTASQYAAFGAAIALLRAVAKADKEQVAAEFHGWIEDVPLWVVSRGPYERHASLPAALASLLEPPQ